MILKRPAAILIAIAVLATGYALSRFVSASPGYVPEEFKTARAEAGRLAGEIVEISRGIPGDLTKIGELEREKKYEEALAITGEIGRKNVDIRDRAVRLSGELEVMTHSSTRMDSEAAKEAALDAISHRLSLISRLITYTDHVTELVAALQARLSGGGGPSAVSDAIEKINEDVAAINDLDARAASAIARFDKIVK